MTGLVIWSAGTTANFAIAPGHLESFVKLYSDVKVQSFNGALVYVGYTENKQPILFIPMKGLKV
jgi:hypothetical protein